MGQSGVLGPEDYATFLGRLGDEAQHVEVYAHSLPVRDAVVDWTKGSC